MIYTVEVTSAAHKAIRRATRFIAIECQAPLNAERWLERVWDAIDGLEHMPGRHNLAVENAFKTYEVRRAIVGNYPLSFYAITLAGGIIPCTQMPARNCGKRLKNFSPAPGWKNPRCVGASMAHEKRNCCKPQSL